ncbi:MAG: flagellar biosynthetic protein FliO [candidate division Zixibacteria bacterium]|nr:flagellar biosynthetic protein FliO [candidate division Zixibacteria bacterium]
MAAILGLAFMGLLFINTDPVTADRTAASVLQEGQGQTEVTESDLSSAMATSALPSLLKMLSALVVVVLCIYVGIFLLKRTMGRRYAGNRRNSVLEVLETTYVGPKKTVSLIRVADKAVLVGITDGAISVLAELDANQTAEITARENVEKENYSFRRMLSAASQKMRSLSLTRNRAALAGRHE